METQAYQIAANATAAPAIGAVYARLAECKKSIGHMVDQSRPGLSLCDDIKKHIFYGKVPKREIPCLNTNPAGDCLRTEGDVDLIHALLGILSEGEELLTPLKMLGLPVTMDEQETKEFHQNLREEMGDLLWYIALAARGLGTTLEELMETNIRKLNEKTKGRYRNGFTEIAAIERDTAAEATLLEGNCNECPPQGCDGAKPCEDSPPTARQ